MWGGQGQVVSPLEPQARALWGGTGVGAVLGEPDSFAM